MDLPTKIIKRSAIALIVMIYVNVVIEVVYFCADLKNKELIDSTLHMFAYVAFCAYIFMRIIPLIIKDIQTLKNK